MKHTALAITVSGFILAGAAGAGWAQDSAHPAGDIEAGRKVAEICAGCHGLEGISETPGIPHLSGQYAEYLFSSLEVYSSGERTSREMHGVVKGLSAEDRANVASYFASLKPFNQIPGGTQKPLPVETDPFEAVKEATADCAGCHGEDGNSEIPGMPSLAGQPVAYLLHAMAAYQDGTRKNEEMQPFLEGLDKAAIEDMAYFYAAMEPKKPEPPAEGDPYAGVAVTAPCAGCHGEDGNSKDPKLPRLAGQDAEYLTVAVAGYASGDRGHDVMRDAVSTLRVKDIQDMAAYYATKDPVAHPIRKPLSMSEWAGRCDRCHGVGGNSKDPRFPILARQDEAYLAKALKLYHVGDRESSTMKAMSFLMTESDINKMAAYYARQPVAK